jgi:hypothetical protein
MNLLYSKGYLIDMKGPFNLKKASLAPEELANFFDYAAKLAILFYR